MKTKTVWVKQGKPRHRYKYTCSYGISESANDYHYIVIHSGDLDLNNAIFLRRRKDLVAYLSEKNFFEYKKPLHIFRLGKPVKFEIRRVKQ